MDTGMLSKHLNSFNYEGSSQDRRAGGGAGGENNPERAVGPHRAAPPLNTHTRGRKAGWGVGAQKHGRQDS